MNRRQILRRATGLAAASIATPLWAQSAGRIVLGQSAALSGPAAALGLRFREGAMLHFERLNAKGGVNGRQIDLQSLDDGYEPDRCAENTRKLIEGGAFALFGYIGTPTSLAALPLATQAKTPFFAPFTGAEALRAPFNRYAFHVRASYYDETAEIVRQTTAIGIKRIGVFYQNDSYGKAGLEGVTRALKPLGLEPAGLGTVERNTVDVDAAVKAIMAGKPDAIVQISAYKSCAAFIRAARKAGFGGTFYNVSFVGTKALADELGADARGVVVSQVVPFPFTPSSQVAGEYLAAGKAAQGDKFEPNYSSMEGFVAARAFAEGLKRAGANAGTDALINGLESLRDLNLGGFFVDFSPTRHTGSKYVDLTILTADGHVRR
ncbi:ABC transporter substrate-binding protein [Piscinibacter sp.]|jgi:branched-chain amino acid transport system substrate-binding protein|uniref:ABC transporter substrate-binding protein n=1 Tax=Piscinibacter sp. TaxID=1903157 RepID=UPI001B4A5897|nr:ABC transporter substrate-binding protein [Piscinibacter sp.]MBK7531410.1 ABC transporter substrate-binding protein [Piscinibacter sp.]MBL0093796.1 ABC transporter substrate-binding protein [Piscinibacter sp.]MBP6543960.1 ABC transporter substrate-binding protein [Piscinibacter sp.]HPG80136.1 ABC transporter substrate-binding protein [Piscinibacter sp.]